MSDASNNSSQVVLGSFESWPAYWTALGMPWRTEPEIAAERQAYLAERRAVQPDIEQGIYPFRDASGPIRLDRADVEWLLATHESAGMRGPIDWLNPAHRSRGGLDLRGAIADDVDLSGLPLAKLMAGISRDAPQSMAQVRDESAQTYMQRLLFEWATSNIRDIRTSFQRAIFSGAQLQEADFTHAKLQYARFYEAHLEGAIFNVARLEHANFVRAHLPGASLRFASLEAADFVDADMRAEKVNPSERLHHAKGRRYDYAGVFAPARFEGAVLDSRTTLNSLRLGDARFGFASMADVSWGAANIAVVDWGSVSILGDEREAREPKTTAGHRKTGEQRRQELATAIRAYRQLATALRMQGLNEQSDRFSYRAQVLQRKLLFQQRRPVRWFFPLVLACLSGYGFRLWRILGAYLFVLVGFAALYFVLGLPHPHPVSQFEALRDAFLVSLTAIHGRVFLEQLGQYSIQAWVAALESVVGIVIEGVFVAMLVQRFFGGR